MGYLSHSACPLPTRNVRAESALVEDSQHVGYEENQQYGAEPYARAPAITPAAVAVEPSAAP
jgi:hypothetical protein